MTRRRRSIFPILLVTFLGLIVLFVLASAGFALIELPRLAENRFGPSSPKLDRSERVLYAARLFLHRDDLIKPVDAGGKIIPFRVELGEGVPTLSERLQKEGLVRSADTFRWYLIYAGLDTGIQAGEYQLSTALNTIQIAHALQDATPTEVSFSILPGWRAEEIAAGLPTSGLKITPEEFLKLVHDPQGQGVTLPDGWPELKSLEGFLYPDVYRVKRDISAKKLIQIILTHFDEQVGPELRQALSNKDFDLESAVILASMVQREAVVAEEQPIIASVFLNRQTAGMKLDSDPTVQYALGYNQKQKSWWTNPLSAEDLQVSSPYNTYQNPGLPPGPISNPSLSAIQSVAYPAQTPYYYFRARCDNSGRHKFAKTLEEQVQNGCE